jgi:hypothetical protein
MLLTLFSFTLFACGSDSSDSASNTDTGSSDNTEFTENDLQGINMESLIVAESFDWKTTHNITLTLTLVNESSEVFSKDKIEIYSNVGDFEQSLPEDASLLFSGWPNQQGILSLQHQIKKGDKKLVLQTRKNNNVSFVDIDLSDADFDEQTSTYSMVVFL